MAVEPAYSQCDPGKFEDVRWMDGYGSEENLLHPIAEPSTITSTPHTMEITDGDDVIISFYGVKENLPWLRPL